MKPVNHYNTATWFANWHYETFWKGVDVVQLPSYIVDDMRRDLMRTGKPFSLENVRTKPWLRFRNGLFLPAGRIPVAGGADGGRTPPRVLTPFGIEWPYTGAGADNGAFSGGFANRFQQYRDLTLSGDATPADTEIQQIVICRTLNLAGQQLHASGYGPRGTAGGTGAGAGGAGGNGGASTAILITSEITPSATVPFDPYETIMADGGNSGSGFGANGAVGLSASTGNLFAALSLYYLMIGCTGGGAGGAGAGGITTGTGVLGGHRGGKGANGSTTASGGGGGSGIGGGGGGGAGWSVTGGTGGNGGHGGGVIVVVCDDVVGSFGYIRANGASAGTGGSGTHAGGGGGGGGGLALLFTRALSTVGTTVEANGISGGTATGSAGHGASGGNGIAKLVRSR